MQAPPPARSVTKTVTIDRPAAEVHAFLADATNWPRWAIVNIVAVEPGDDPQWWRITTPDGSAELRLRADAATGVVDHDFRDESMDVATVPARVVPNGRGADFSMTVTQPPEVDDAFFEELMGSVETELTTLKAVLEAPSDGVVQTSRQGATATPMENALDEADRPALLAALEYQRASVRAIVAGLSEEHWHTSVVPSGWTPAGLVAHLGGAERHWTCGVVLAADPGHPFDKDFDDAPYDPSAPFVIDWPSEKVLAYYQDQTRHTDEMLASTPLDATPLGHHGGPDTEQPVSVREIVLHLIEETAAHSGHLEIARELLDGRTRLGLR